VVLPNLSRVRRLVSSLTRTRLFYESRFHATRRRRTHSAWEVSPETNSSRLTAPSAPFSTHLEITTTRISRIRQFVRCPGVHQCTHNTFSTFLSCKHLTLMTPGSLTGFRSVKELPFNDAFFFALGNDGYIKCFKHDDEDICHIYRSLLSVHYFSYNRPSLFN